MPALAQAGCPLQILHPLVLGRLHLPARMPVLQYEHLHRTCCAVTVPYAFPSQPPDWRMPAHAPPTPVEACLRAQQTLHALNQCVLSHAWLPCLTLSERG